MKKFTYLFVTLTLVAALGLAGCSNQSGSTTKDGKTNVTFWHSMDGNLADALNDIVDDFNKQSDDVHVDAEYQGDYPDSLSKLRGVAGSSSAPAAIQVYDLGTKYMSSSDFITPMQKFIDDDDYDTSQLVDATKAYYTIDDDLQAMPFNASTAVMYYNKDMFKDAGLDPDKAPETFEDITKAANQIKDKTDNTGFSFATIGWFFEELLANQNADYLNHDNGRKGDNPTDARVNSEEGVKTLEWLKNMNDSGSFKNYGSDWDDPKGPFESGKVGMLLASSGSLKEIIDTADFDVGTAYVPYPKDAKRQGIPVGGASTWITNEVSDKEQKAAWKFVKYMSKPDVQAKWAQDSGYFPVSEDAYDLDEMKDLYKDYPQFKTASDQLNDTEISPATQGALTESMPENRDAIETALGELYNGKDPQDVLDKAAKKIKKNLKE